MIPMSTRAVFTFSDPDTVGSPFVVYKHYDGYPTGALEALQNAREVAWPLPRFEADEFAAAFIAANKTGPGGVRIVGRGPWNAISPADIEYAYHVVMFASGHVRVSGHAVAWNDETGALEAGPAVLIPFRLRDLASKAAS